MDPIRGAARHLFRAAENGDQGALLPEAITPKDMYAAYRVQDALQALWVEAGAGEVDGWKVCSDIQGDAGIGGRLPTVRRRYFCKSHSS